MICDARITQYVKDDGKGYVVCMVQIHDYLIKKGKSWTYPFRANMPRKMYEAWGIMNKRACFFNIMSGSAQFPQVKFRSLASEPPSKKWNKTPNFNKFG